MGTRKFIGFDEHARPELCTARCQKGAGQRLVRVSLCVVATSTKTTQHNVAQTFVCFQVALVEAIKTGNRNRVRTAIVKRKSKVTSCAMLFSPQCVWCKSQ